MDAFEYSESDVLYTQLSLFQKFMKKHKRKELGKEDRNAGIQGIPIVGRIASNPPG